MSLFVVAAFLASAYDKCYCVDCHSKRTDKAYYNRGEPPKTYAVPVGWMRFGLRYRQNHVDKMKTFNISIAQQCYLVSVV